MLSAAQVCAITASALVVALLGCSDGDKSQVHMGTAIPDSSTIQGKLKRACEQVATTNDVAVLCPTWLPSVENALDAYRGYRVSQDDFEPRRRCQYLTQLGYSGEHAGTEVPSHVLFGGRCDPWPMAVRNGRWPAQVGNRAGLGDKRLRMVNVMRVPGRANARIIKPRVVGRALIDDGRALLLWFAPHPAGGIHGGHYGVIWNSDGHGYALTLHYNRGDATYVGRGRTAPPNRAQRQALMQTARKMLAQDAEMADFRALPTWLRFTRASRRA